MRFLNIKISKEGVELDRQEKAGSTIIKTTLADSAAPLPEFKAALQAVSGFACELIGASHWHDDINVASVHLSEEPRTNRRGLVITITRKIERAKGRVVVINTPLMHAPAEDQEGTNPGTFPQEIVEMIATLEAEATRYWNGEREQAEMFPKGAAAGETDDQAPATSAKPRGKKNRDFIPGVGPVANPDATEELTDDTLRQLLLQVSRDVPVDAIARWTSGERDSAFRWARGNLEARLNSRVYEGVEPKCLTRDATPSLSADDWTQPTPPPKASDVTPITTGV